MPRRRTRGVSRPIHRRDQGRGRTRSRRIQSAGTEQGRAAVVQMGRSSSRRSISTPTWTSTWIEVVVIDGERCTLASEVHGGLSLNPIAVAYCSNPSLQCHSISLPLPCSSPRLCQWMGCVCIPLPHDLRAPPVLPPPLLKFQAGQGRAGAVPPLLCSPRPPWTVSHSTRDRFDSVGSTIPYCAGHGQCRPGIVADGRRLILLA